MNPNPLYPQKAGPSGLATVINSQTNEYDAAGLKLTSRGVSFQKLLLILAAMRTSRKDANFSLATEMVAAEKFDDLVLRHQVSGDYHYDFLQAKHKDDLNNKITLAQLMSDAKTEGDFALKKYFNSYLSIVNNPEFSNGKSKNFFIATNIDFHDHIKSAFKTVDANTINSVFHFNYPKSPQKVTYLKLASDKLSDGDKTKLFTVLKKAEHLTQTPGQDTQLINAFFEQLVFIVNIPNEAQLKEILLEELQQKEFNAVDDAKFITGAFDLFFSEWMGNKKGRFLKSDDLSTLKSIIKENINWLKLSYSNKVLTNESNHIDFSNEDEIILKFLNNELGGKLFNLVAGSGWRIASARVIQALNKSRSYQLEGSYVFLEFNHELHAQEKKPILETYQKVGKSDHLLIIRVKSISEHEIAQLNDFLSKLSQITQNCANRKVLLITSGEDQPVQNAVEKVSTYQHLDKTNFYDLAITSKEKLFQKYITFQDRKVKLGALVNLKALNQDILGSVVDESNIKVGCPLSELGEVESYYITRNLNQSPLIFDQQGFKKILGNNAKDLFFISGKVTESAWIEHLNQEFAQKNPIEAEAQVKFITFSEATVHRNFEKFCDSISDKAAWNIHWLELEKREFIWKQTKGNFENFVVYLKRKLSKESSLKSTENDLIDSTQIKIISGDPGSGKSTLIKQLAQRLKTANPSDWVVQLDLPDAKDSIANIFNTGGRITEFLSETIRGNSPLENEIIAHLIEKKRIILLLDGFDELEISSQTQLITLLNTRKEGDIKHFYITTRSHLNIQLEIALGAPAYQIEILSKDNHSQFLKNFWNKKLGLNEMENEPLSTYIDEVISYFNQHSTLKKLIGNPLTLRFLATILTPHCKNFIQNPRNNELITQQLMLYFKSDLNVFELYTRFLQTQYEASLAPGTTEYQKGILIPQYAKTYGSFAVKQLFPENRFFYEANLKKQEEYPDIRNIADVDEKGKTIRFTHQTLVEYYTAHRIFSKIKSQLSLISSLGDQYIVFSKLDDRFV